jgi:catechol 2,3-dioxygenase-like lactoylglutathione lyase family enzyme
VSDPSKTQPEAVTNVGRMKLRPAVIEIVVADMASSLAFYRRLGLDIAPEADGEPHVDVDLGGMHLAFDTRETILSFNPGWTPPTGGHGMALAFACDSPAEVDAAYAELTGAGADGALEPWDAFWGMRYAVVHDPDGNPVDLFAPLG